MVFPAGHICQCTAYAAQGLLAHLRMLGIVCVGDCRQVQDEFAAVSHRKAAAAQAAGKFNAEIVPVRTKVKDPKTGNEQQVGVACIIR